MTHLKSDRLFRPVAADGATSLLSDLAAQQIQDLISSGSLKAGSKLPPERELAQRLGVSRTALREALRILEATGAVEANVGKGRFVRSRPLSPRAAMRGDYFEANRNEIAELNHVLQLVEPAGVLEIPSHLLPEVAAEARAIYERAVSAVEAGDEALAAKLDCEFHRCLCARTPNRLLRELIERLVDSFQESGRAVYAIPAAAARSLSQHLEIIVALEAGSREAASDNLRRHAAVAYRFAAQQISSPSS